MKRRTPTQRDRVAKVGLAAGRRGTHQGEWLAPGGADGRGRVTRLASRIAELRDAGWRIRTAGKRQGFRVYVFDGAPAAPALAVPATGQLEPVLGTADALFEPTAQRPASPYDDLETAA